MISRSRTQLRTRRKAPPGGKVWDDDKADTAALSDELFQLTRRLRLPYLPNNAPEIIATAKAQRWDPAEVLRVLLQEEAKGRDIATREYSSVHRVNASPRQAAELSWGRVHRSLFVLSVLPAASRWLPPAGSRRVSPARAGRESAGQSTAQHKRVFRCSTGKIPLSDIRGLYSSWNSAGVNGKDVHLRT